MRINCLKLTNFRRYSKVVKINFDDLTAFVGRNDAGKSTILEALDIFFNDGKGVVKIDKNDVNVGERENGNVETVITVCFDDLPNSIIIDSTIETDLKSEYMLNRDGKLEIVKKFNNGGTPKIYIKAMHPTNEVCSDLLLKKNTELKKIINSNGIDCETLTINSVMRKSIWRNYIDDLRLDEIEIDASKEDAKKIWERLVRYLPIYSLFQSDRKNSDSDDEIQDPLKEAVKQILNDESLREDLEHISNVVLEKLSEVSDRTLTKIREMNPEIAESLNPVIPSPQSLKWQDVFKSVSIAGDAGIPVNKRGSGVKRLILLNFFRAEAERRMEGSDNDSIIYAIEEPETSQHIEHQSVLINAFKTLSLQKNTQVVITTHSSNIVKKLAFENLRMVSTNENGNMKVENIDPGLLKYPSLNEVNYVAFGDVTEEYHNELYSQIESMDLKADYELGKDKIVYKKVSRNGNVVDLEITLTEYIRHQIHHPENKLNDRFSQNELKKSIELMRDFLEAST